MSHILIIEDDEQFRQMLSTMLAADSHRVSEARDGEEGLRLLGQGKPELIITDILMPKIDGIEFIMELKRRGYSIPVIAISGGRRAISAEFNLNSAELMGVAVTLPKPFSREALRSAIKQAQG